MKDTQRMYTLIALKMCANSWFDILTITEATFDVSGIRYHDGSISRRLRELRTPKYGNHIIERKVFDGVHKYRYMGVME